MLIAGFDEVGRGAWAGPLVVAGVALDESIDTNFKDSKTYTPAGRRAALLEIYKSATAISVSAITATEIDEIGLAAALKKAFVSAASTIGASPERYIIDGTIDYLSSGNSQAVTKADTTFQSVAAASIVAKVHRDLYMHRVGQINPRYGFEHHVGYGTAQHKQQLMRYGPAALHRQSFKPVKASL